MMNPRNLALSPVSTDSPEWSPVANYRNIAPDNPYSPAIPPASFGSLPNADGGMLNGMRSAPNGNPSPPSSIGRSSDTTGVYSARMSDVSVASTRKMLLLEETLSEHYKVLQIYLAPYLNDAQGNPRPSRAKDKLTRLSAVQFQELSTDVYDESIRREDDRKRGPGAPANDTPQYLLPKPNFHPKRNQARQKLSTLPLERFRQLATDVFYELERRFPRFTAGDLPRSSSPSGSVASRMSNRGPPSRSGTPNSMGSRPPPGPGYRGTPPQGGPQGSLMPGGRQQNALGRPLPKTFQSNTIVPNKGMLVEDDDDSIGDDDDAFNLEGAAARRQTNKSAKSMSIAQDKIVADLESQLKELQGKLGTLETSLRDKDDEIQRLKEADSMRDGNTASERAEWDDLRFSLEEKVEQAEMLNSALRADIDRLRSENEDAQRSLRAQIAELESRPAQQTSDGGGGGGSSSSSSSSSEWRQRCEDLERELSEQQQVTEEVRQDAALFLQEMRELSTRSDAAVEKEERLVQQVSSLEAELKDWKSRYARVKTQLRTLKASSIGLSAMASPDISNYTRDPGFSTPDGLVKDVHVTKFQLSIDELLQTARRAGTEQTLQSMRHVVKCVRAITGDIDSTSLSQMQSPNSSFSGDLMPSPEKQQAKLKSRVSATANNLITATKNHVSSNGISPVSLLDAAASHLATAVVELVKHVKVRPTPQNELEDLDEDDDRPMPLKSTVFSGYAGFAPNGDNGNANGTNPVLGHRRQQSSRGGSSDTTGYSTYSSPYSGYDSQGPGMNGTSPPVDKGMIDFKNYLEDQTALLVRSIQPLVNLIRSSPTSTPADEQQIYEYIQDISQAVEDTGNRTYDAVDKLSNPALKKHALPVVDVLDDCRQNMISVDIRGGGRDKIPPLAFKTARALKELVLRVDRIESGELTFEQTLTNEF
ncbi:component of the polarisome [Pleosporales sp. CAS-2024a]